MLSAEDLTQITWHCVRFVSSLEDSSVESELRGGGVAVFHLDAATIETKDQLLASIATEMRFPDYFGMNWDALDECLTDLEWLPASGYVLFVRGADVFWRRSSRLAGVFVETWLSAAQEWASRRIPMHLVFVW